VHRRVLEQSGPGDYYRQVRVTSAMPVDEYLAESAPDSAAGIIAFDALHHNLLTGRTGPLVRRKQASPIPQTGANSVAATSSRRIPVYGRINSQLLIVVVHHMPSIRTICKE
jgi:hypothetical protein